VLGRGVSSKLRPVARAGGVTGITGRFGSAGAGAAVGVGAGAAAGIGVGGVGMLGAAGVAGPSLSS